MKGKWGFTGWALAACGVVGVALGGLIVHLQGRLAGAREELARAKIDYAEGKRLRIEYRGLEAKKQRIPAGDRRVDPATYASFLSSKAKEAGLPAPTITPGSAMTSGRWREQPYSVVFAGRPDQPVSRAGLIRFVERVETAAPTFKSRELSFTFAPDPARGDLVAATVVFSHFDQPPGR